MLIADVAEWDHQRQAISCLMGDLSASASELSCGEKWLQGQHPSRGVRGGYQCNKDGLEMHLTRVSGLVRPQH